MSPRRHTFVVQVREPDGTSLLENVRTRERVVVSDLREVGREIGRWLAALREQQEGTRGGAEKAPTPAAGLNGSPTRPARGAGESPDRQRSRFSRPSGDG